MNLINHRLDLIKSKVIQDEQLLYICKLVYLLSPTSTTIIIVKHEANQHHCNIPHRLRLHGHRNRQQ